MHSKKFLIYARDDKLVARCLNDLYLGEVKAISPSKAGNSSVFSCAIVWYACLHDFNSRECTLKSIQAPSDRVQAPPWEYT